MGKSFRLFIALLTLTLLTLTLSINISNVKAQGSPTKSVLIVVNDAASNKFGRYLGEILIAEGLNSFDLNTVNAINISILSQYQVIVLAETPLTPTQASTFITYVNNGGYLIAMRPDSQIASLFDLGASQGTQSDGYLKMNGMGPSQGLSTVTLQIHGTVDRYTLSGASTLAQLYSNATTSTVYPAVAQSANSHGTAFLYDLAKSIVYTRQGNPANANVDVDGDGVLRSIDLFYNSNGTTWVDRDKIPVPQADEQQRFFARLVQQAINNYQPMPQLWYFPGVNKTILIITGDAHANPPSSFQSEINSLNSHNAKATFYLSMGGGITDSNIQTWRSQGHEFGIHPPFYKPDTYPPYNITNLNQGFDVYLSWYDMAFSTIPSRTVRNHQVAWSGWTDAADIAVSHGFAMDANFYHWGPWLQKPDGSWAHGYITGSGQPMKFMRADGTILPYYQQLTQLVDEQMFQINDGYPAEGVSASGAITISKQLIDSSETGDYAAIMTQFHVDYFGGDQPWIDGTLSYAQSKSIPMINSDTWLNFIETRHSATYSNIVWNNASKTLSFNLTTPVTTTNLNLSTVLPLNLGTGTLQSVVVDGSQSSFSNQLIKGSNVAFVTTTAGNHSFIATYSGGGIIPTDTPISAPTSTLTSTPVPTLTSTPTSVPTSTLTPTSTFTGTFNPPTETPTETPTSTFSPTFTSTFTFTPTFTSTRTPTPTSTPTSTRTPTSTATVTSTQVSGQQTVTFVINSGINDVNEDGTSFVSNTTTDWIGSGANPSASFAGLRFTGITIPHNATIVSAHLEVYSVQGQWIQVTMQTAADLSDNSAAFSASSKPSQRTLTTAKIAHSSNTNWAANTWYSLDEIKAVVQEIVNRSGWQSGNSLSLILKGTASGRYGRKNVRAFEGGAAQAIRLVVTYTFP